MGRMLGMAEPTPIARLAERFVKLRERPRACAECGQPTGDESERFCSPEHETQWFEANAI